VHSSQLKENAFHPLTVNFDLQPDLERVKLNQHAKCQRSFSSKVTVRTCRTDCSTWTIKVVGKENLKESHKIIRTVLEVSAVRNVSTIWQFSFGN